MSDLVVKIRWHDHMALSTNHTFASLHNTLLAREFTVSATKCVNKPDVHKRQYFSFKTKDREKYGIKCDICHIYFHTYQHQSDKIVACCS